MTALTRIANQVVQRLLQRCFPFKIGQPVAFESRSHNGGHLVVTLIVGHDDDHLVRWYRAETFGFLHASIGLPCDGKLIPWLQPQHEYLREHNLLTPEELAHPDLEREAR